MNSKAKPRGRPFQPGNPGGPGRPKRETETEYLNLFTQQVTQSAFVRIVDKLLEMAEAGDLKAIQLLLRYALGRPESLWESSQEKQQEMNDYDRAARFRQFIEEMEQAPKNQIA
ncbi:MAG: hypothetical protein KDB68_17690 [Planctomycetes bacterium]|nr:hypothetical protein [Planctomycetota bacterium]